MSRVLIIDASANQRPSSSHIASTLFVTRVDQAHVKRVIKARRDLCVGEDVKVVQ